MQHKDVFELLGILNASEKERLAFVINSKRRKGTNTNDLILYLLSQTKLPSKQDVYNGLDKKGYPFTEEGYQRMIARAYSDVLDFLNDFIQKGTKEFEEIDTVKIQILQKATLLQFLIAKKSKISLVATLREEIIKSATEFEFYPLLIEQLYLKKHESSLVDGENAYFEFEEMIAHFEMCSYWFRKASELFNLFKMKSLKTTVHSDKIFGKLLKENIGILIEGYKISNSPTVKYFLFQHQLSLLYLNKNYIKAKQKCLEMKKLVEENKSINRVARIGIIYDNLAKYDTYLSNYSEAIIWSKKAQECFGNESRNYWVSFEQEFLINVYGQNFSRAEEILTQIFNGKQKDKNDFERNTLLFYQAILFFKNEDFKKALAIFSERNEMSQDSTGWDFWARIISIYLNVLLGNEDVASKGVLNIKKQIQRISKNTDFRERDMIVFEIFLQLSKKGFSTFQPIAKIELLLTKLKETKNQWKPFTAEVIPFEKLFSMKYKKYAIL